MPLPNPFQIVVKEPFRFIDFSTVSNALNYQHQRITISIRNIKESHFRPLVVLEGSGERNRKMQARSTVTPPGGGCHSYGSNSSDDDNTLYSHRLESIQCLPDMMLLQKEAEDASAFLRKGGGGGIVLSCLFENSVGGPFQKSKLLYEPKVLRNDLESKIMEIGSEDLLDGDNDDSLLRVEIAKSYRVVNVEIVQGRNLVAKDRQFGFVGKKTSSDPYVKVNLIGRDQVKWRSTSQQQQQQQQTQIQKKTLNPVWNELLQIKVPLNEPLTEGQLILQIMDHDKGSLDDPMGRVVIPASEIVEGRSMELSRYRKWYKVSPTENCTNATGDLLVSATVRNVDGLRGRSSGNGGSVTTRRMEQKPSFPKMPPQPHHKTTVGVLDYTAASPSYPKFRDTRSTTTTTTTPTLEDRRRATIGPTPNSKAWPDGGAGPAAFRPSWLVK